MNWSEFPKYNHIHRHIITTRSYYLQCFVEKNGIEWTSAKDIGEAHGIPYNPELFLKLKRENQRWVLLGDSSKPVLCINEAGHRELLQLAYDWAGRLQNDLARAMLMQREDQL